jgi:hypothetical protein
LESFPDSKESDKSKDSRDIPTKEKKCFANGKVRIRIIRRDFSFEDPGKSRRKISN